ncbi:MAG: hypothetical protein IJ870_00375 [Alphaproteobacteria bacterium]|nr:hypothetical protein [Alphaproteobacteria bacterium]
MKKWEIAIGIFLSLAEILIVATIIFGIKENIEWASNCLISAGIAGWLAIFAIIGRKISERRYII